MRWLPILLVILLIGSAAAMVLQHFSADFSPETTPRETSCHHDWVPATCTSPQVCYKCGKTSGAAIAHNWTSATCTEAMYCTGCGLISGNAVGHQWVAATCTEAKYCSVCGMTSGNPIDHQWVAATCTEAQYCAVCGKTSGNAKGHQWVAATYSAPKTCSVCGLTEGNTLENPLVEHLKDRLPIVTYAMSSTRKVYGYEDSGLTRKSESRYLESNAGEIVISDITDDGSALKVTFHSKSTASGYDTLWFPFEDILQIQDVDISYHTARVCMDTYKPVHSSFVITRYGGMDPGWDFCYLGTHESGYFIITYRVFEQKVHGFSIYDKIALIKTRP